MFDVTNQKHFFCYENSKHEPSSNEGQGNKTQTKNLLIIGFMKVKRYVMNME